MMKIIWDLVLKIVFIRMNKPLIMTLFKIVLYKKKNKKLIKIHNKKLI